MENLSDEYISEQLKRKYQFVSDHKGFYRKWIFITLDKGKMKIGHLRGIEGNGTADRLPKVMSSFDFKDIDEWLKYFDRI